METELLIIDDDEIALMLHDQSVISGGLHSSPKLFSKPEVALLYVKENKDENKTLVLLLDINMPVMNGWELLDALDLDKDDKQVLVVLVTSSVDPDDRLKAEKYSHIIEFIEKPFTRHTARKLRTHNALQGIFG